MSGLFDIYVLGPDRSKESVERFLNHFMPSRSEAADDYAVPLNSDHPTRKFENADDLLAYLEAHPGIPHAIYWTSDARGDPRCAMVFPTSDGSMIYGLSVERDQEQFLTTLKEFLSAAEGYISFEAPPAGDAAAFAAAVRRFEESRTQD